MGILIDKDTCAIIQGITGTQGSFHTRLMLDYGTKIVAGTSPGKGGSQTYDLPIYDTVAEVKDRFRVDASVIFVPAPFAADAAFEAIANGIKTIVVITEHIPIRDAVDLMAFAKQKTASVIGPNTPGIITPGECKLGIMPAHIFQAGNIGLVSRSGTLTYEIAAGLTRAGLGQSTCMGMGGDPVTGLNFIDALRLFRDDSSTEAVVLVGEIGGNIEELAADFIANEKYAKPVIAFIAGRSAPPGKRMGHAGAIIMGKAGTAVTKMEALKDAGASVAEKPGDIPELVRKSLHR